jgi:hypothetical protein
MNFHQNIEQILAAATPEQKILWNYVFLRWGERIGITQLVQWNLIGDLAVYSANKMYLAYQVQISSGTTPQVAVITQMTAMYDETNTLMDYLGQIQPYWDTTAAGPKYLISGISYKNLLFSRLTATSGIITSFIGYRLSI